MIKAQITPLRIDTTVFEGGLDLTSKSIVKKPGALLACKNYEPELGGGYTRIAGYERFNGMASPTDATYSEIGYNTPITAFTVGSDILGGTSGATARVIADTGTSIAITMLTGAFVTGELIRNSLNTLTHATATTGSTFQQSITSHDTYVALAREQYRAAITAIPGSGAIRGVTMYNGNVYAFRDNIGGTAGAMWETTPAGWVQITDLGGRVAFSVGTTAAPAAGVTVTGVTSGATGIVNEAVNTGSWTANTATGTLHLRTVTGTFTATEQVTWTGGSATVDTYTANALPPGGQYEFINYNFKGNAGTDNLYGANGVGQAFQWDEVGFSFIETGMTVDTPTHITASKRHLFLSFGASVQHSSIGNPMEWSPITGAGEIGTGDVVTGFNVLPNNALAIFDRNSTYILYGTSAVDWNLTTLSETTGAIEYSIQPMGQSPMYLDDRGITQLNATQAYGNFKANSISKMIDPIVQLKKNTLLSSIRIRDKDQYRLFFADNTGIIYRDKAFTSLEFPIPVNCTASVEDLTGGERLFFGSDTGYVYEMDKGDSFDGALISYSIRTAFNNFRSPRNRKRFIKVVIDAQNTDVPPLSILPDYGYGDPNIPSAMPINENTLTLSGGFWDGYDTWGNFAWDGMITGQAEARIKGSAINLSLLILGESNYEAPHTLEAISIHYSILGLKK